MNPGSPIVFLGPSLPVARASRMLDAVYGPPLCRGGLDRVPSPATVLVIDGVLDVEYRLTVEEARRAISRGLTLYGSASTGALLAAALHDAGMTGTGRVYALFRAGRIDADDIAVLHYPHDPRPLTEPLVNVIAWLDHLAGADRLERSTAAAAISDLRAMRIEQRTRSGIMAVLKRYLGSSLRGCRTCPWPNLKAADAQALLSCFRSSSRPRPAFPRHEIDRAVPSG